MHASLIHSFASKFLDSAVLVRTAMVEHGVALLRQLPVTSLIIEPEPSP